MQPRRCFLAVVVTAMLAPAPAGADPAISTFTNGPEGWTVSAEGRGPVWTPDGGAPGGYISGYAAVPGADWHFRAPQPFLGNHAASYGQILELTLRRSAAGTGDPLEILLTGNGVALSFQQVVTGDGWWTPVVAPLFEGAGWRRVAPGPAGPATRADFLLLLRNITAFQVRAGSRDMFGRVDLDSVTLPEGVRITTRCPSRSQRP